MSLYEQNSKALAKYTINFLEINTGSQKSSNKYYYKSLSSSDKVSLRHIKDR
jgi:hypothetical protein